MTSQAELIAAVAKDAGVSKADAGRVIEAVIKQLRKSLKSGDSVLVSDADLLRETARIRITGGRARSNTYRGVELQSPPGVSRFSEAQIRQAIEDALAKSQRHASGGL